MKIMPFRQRSNDQLADIRDIRDTFEQMFEPFFESGIAGPRRLPSLFGESLVPPVNIAENDKQWTITCELPGLLEKDICVETRGDSLVISGERRFEEESKKGDWVRVESRYGSFRRSVPLPRNARVEADMVAASFKNGVLEVVVPKIEPTPTGKVKIRGS